MGMFCLPQQCCMLFVLNTNLFCVWPNLERDRRLPNHNEVQFDACPPSDHDRAVDALMAEMDRVLARRPCCTSYVDDKSVQPADMKPIQSRELLQSAREMRRVGGQINKALVRGSSKANPSWKHIADQLRRIGFTIKSVSTIHEPLDIIPIFDFNWKLYNSIRG